MAFWHVSSRFVIWARWNVVVLFCFFFVPSVFNVQFGHFRALRLVYFFGGCSRCDMPERWLSRHCMWFPVTAGLLRGSSLKRSMFSQDDRRGQCCVHVWEPTRTIPFPLRLRQPWICRGVSSAPDTVLVFQESWWFNNEWDKWGNLGFRYLGPWWHKKVLIWMCFVCLEAFFCLECAQIWMSPTGGFWLAILKVFHSIALSEVGSLSRCVVCFCSPSCQQFADSTFPDSWGCSCVFDRDHLCTVKIPLSR